MAPRLVRIVVTQGAQDPRWKLLPTARGSKSMALLGWVLDAPALDAGVPEAVARILVRALCRVGTLTFLHESARVWNDCKTWAKTPEGWACVLRPAGLARWLGTSAFPLVCTIQEPTALRLFDAEGFAWELQGQVVILTGSDASPPRLSVRDLQALLDRTTVDLVRFAANTGALGLLLPAVDGDFAQWIAWGEPTGNEFLALLRQSCDEAGVFFDQVPESEFQRISWYQN